ncbi:MAG: alkaline phosphatase family protein [Vicinamibacteria bacterium]|nr:alkaline phosphatase family protein [Vicinamibacteria bacterium]
MSLKRWRGVLAASSILALSPALIALYLNPNLKLSREALALFAVLVLPHLGPAFVLVGLWGTILGLFLSRRTDRRSPIPGLPGFTRHAAFGIVASAALYWFNLWQYRHSVPLETARAFAACSVVISLAAVVVLTVGLDVLFYPSRRRGFGAPMVVLATAATVIAPLLLRPALESPTRTLPLRIAPTKPMRRVTLVGMDGVSWSEVQDQVARGNLPAFRSILRRGAFGPLATLRPTEGPPVWTTILTGRFPRDHGVKGAVGYRLWGSRAEYDLLPRGVLVGVLQRTGLLASHAVSASSRRVKTVWNALNAFEIEVGVVRLWGTHPAERVRGFMLSGGFHTTPVHRLDEALFPLTLAKEVVAKRTRPSDVDRAFVSEFIDLATAAQEKEPPFWQRDLVERALAPDLTYLRAGAVLRAVYDPPFFATCFSGRDVAGRAFLRYARPEKFGDVHPAEVRRYGHVIDRYSGFLGQIVAEMIENMKREDVLIVISAYGMDPVPLHRRIVSRLTRGEDRSGTHGDAPDGFIAAIGNGIREGVDFRNASVLDVTPTILHLMGLPVARDMEGRVATEVLETSFMLDHPVSYVPSYESLDVAPMAETFETDSLPGSDEER